MARKKQSGPTKRTQAAAKALAKPKKPSAKKPDKKTSSYQRHKEKARQRQAKQSEEGRDIASDMPKITDEAQRERVSKSLRAFCEECMPEKFHLGWSPDHLKVIRKMEQSILHGESFAIAMPRGTGKTTLVVAAIIWAILCGHKKYAALIGADRDAATKLLNNIKVQLETNDKLYELFPEAIHPVRRLEGIANRCRGQIYNGDRTYIAWTAKSIQFASIPSRGEPTATASGAIIETAGIRGKVRGMQTALPNGQVARPDVFVVDDPQTDVSAKSRTQVKARLDVITGTCPGLAGPGESISGFVTCTVIVPDDVADQILNPQKFPDYQGERCQLVYQWPTNMDLWDDYSTIYRESVATGAGMEACNRFVMKNWDSLHKGSEVAWDTRKKANELSSLQHAFNLRIKLGDTFWSEYQNLPLVDDDSEDLLTVDQIQIRTNGFGRGVVPHDANLITAYIDVQGECLFWGVMAIQTATFSCWLLDYGAWPEQRSNYYTKRGLTKKLSGKYSGGREGRLRSGILELIDTLANREWLMPDGTTSLKIGQIGIDAAWGPATRVVQSAAIESPHRAIVLPTFGRCLEAKDCPMDLWKPKPGERLGIGYSIRPRQGGGVYGLLDANHWKSFVHSRLATSIGDDGSLSFFAAELVTTHRMLAEHLRAELREETTKGTRIVHVWTLPDAKPDNDLFDVLAGCCAMASIKGARLAGVKMTKKQPGGAARRRKRPIEVIK
jgi:hypothetical protein